MKTRFAALLTILILSAPALATAQTMLVPMDLSQTNHLKAYGLAYRALTRGYTVEWLLNYRGGSFLMPLAQDNILDARLKDVRY
jgi:hypothetical protein